ncbi:ABC transporter permease [soil metagenome]
MGDAVAAAPGTGRRDIGAVLWPLAGFALILLVWETAPRLGLVRPTSIPPASAVFGEMAVILRDSDFWQQTASSSGRWVIGFVIAIAIGVPIGIAMGRSRLAYHAIDPLLTVTYPTPKAALILILVLMFGAGNVSRITIIVLGCLIPITVSAYHGASGIEPKLLWSAQAMGLGKVRTLVRVVLPASLPQVLSGLRIGIAISVFALIASELLIRQSGIGAYLFTFYDLGATLKVWATASIIAIIGFLLDSAFVALTRLSFRWLEGEV